MLVSGLLCCGVQLTAELQRRLPQAAPPHRSVRRAGTQRAGGRRAAAAFERAGQLCCERRNPAVQLLFLAMFVTCYAVFFVCIFPWLPLGTVSAMHK